MDNFRDAFYVVFSTISESVSSGDLTSFFRRFCDVDFRQICDVEVAVTVGSENWFGIQLLDFEWPGFWNLAT